MVDGHSKNPLHYYYYCMKQLTNKHKDDINKIIHGPNAAFIRCLAHNLNKKRKTVLTIPQKGENVKGCNPQFPTFSHRRTIKLVVCLCSSVKPCGSREVY